MITVKSYIVNVVCNAVFCMCGAYVPVGVDEPVACGRFAAVLLLLFPPGGVIRHGGGCSAAAVSGGAGYHELPPHR